MKTTDKSISRETEIYFVARFQIYLSPYVFGTVIWLLEVTVVVKRMSENYYR